MTIRPDGKIIQHLKDRKPLYLGLYRFLSVDGDKTYLLYSFNNWERLSVELWGLEYETRERGEPFNETVEKLSKTARTCDFTLDEFFDSPLRSAPKSTKGQV